MVNKITTIVTHKICRILVVIIKTKVFSTNNNSQLSTITGICKNCHRNLAIKVFSQAEIRLLRELHNITVSKALAVVSTKMETN